MKTFLSYCSRDAAIVERLADDVRQLGHDVWIDHRLSGGQSWWDELCGAIRECDALIFGITDASVSSEACSAELAYAEAVRKPLIPVQLDSSVSPRLLPPSLAEVQWVDYRDPEDKRSCIELARALSVTRPAPPLPEPLPEPPPVPISYLTELRTTIESAAPLDLPAQRQLFDQLRRRARAEEDEQEVCFLLRRFLQREDLFASVAEDVRALLADTEAAQWQRQRPATLVDAGGGGAGPTARPAGQPPTGASPPAQEASPAPTEATVEGPWAGWTMAALVVGSLVIPLIGLVAGVIGVRTPRKRSQGWWLLGVATVSAFIYFSGFSSAGDGGGGGVNSDPPDGVCDSSRFLQDPDC